MHLQMYATFKRNNNLEETVMIKRNKMYKKKNEGLVEDPHELLLSLVDMGSLDVEDALLACVAEMSDAECKRVLNSLSLPGGCEMEDEEYAVEPMDDVVIDADSSEDDADDVEFEDDEAEDNEETELEARLRRLEKCLHSESMNRNRIRRTPRRRTNR